MAVHMQPMTMMSDMDVSLMDVSVHQDCSDCEDGENMALFCLAVCGVPSVALLLDTLAASVWSSSGRLPIPEVDLLRGMASPPDPSPPRTPYIG